jgi:hypothetical protein
MGVKKRTSGIIFFIKIRVLTVKNDILYAIIFFDKNPRFYTAKNDITYDMINDILYDIKNIRYFISFLIRFYKPKMIFAIPK